VAAAGTGGAGGRGAGGVVGTLLAVAVTLLRCPFDARLSACDALNAAALGGFVVVALPAFIDCAQTSSQGRVNS
jgi:hypothetical protein